MYNNLFIFCRGNLHLYSNTSKYGLKGICLDGDNKAFIQLLHEHSR